MSIYVEYLNSIAASYRDASNGFHPPEAAKKIFEALAGFEPSLDTLAAAIEAQRAGRYASPQEYLTAWRNALGLAEWQRNTLLSAIENAKAADRAKYLGVIVDQGVAVKRAENQQIVDGQLAGHVGQLIEHARNDTIAAGEIRPSGGSRELGAIDLELLQRSIAERAARKEDSIYATQFALIGGQSSES